MNIGSAPVNFKVATGQTLTDKALGPSVDHTLNTASGHFLYWYRPAQSLRVRVDGIINTPVLPLRPNMVIVISTVAATYDGGMAKSSVSIERCQSGRVCMNSCYDNGQLIDCTNRNVLKSVLFDPPFVQAVPSVNLRLIQIDTEDAVFNPDVTLTKENLTLYGMNIRFDLPTDSIPHIICADWIVCSFDTTS